MNQGNLSTPPGLLQVPLSHILLATDLCYSTKSGAAEAHGRNGVPDCATRLGLRSSTFALNLMAFARLGNLSRKSWN